MIYLQVRQTVKDYSKWKPIFDGHASMRKDGGSMGGQMFRDKADPNTITVLLKWDSMENAVKFGQSPDLKKVMMEAGVIGMPDIQFMDEVEKVHV